MSRFNIHEEKGKNGQDEKYHKSRIAIDMNPVTDLAFLLLTFFMLTTTFSKPQTMELLMPAKPKEEDPQQEQPVKESKALSVILAGEDQVYWFVGLTDPQVRQTDYSAGGLRQVLLQMNREIEGLVILIKPTDASVYKNLVDVLDEMNITQMPRYTIVEPTPEDLMLISGKHERK